MNDEALTKAVNGRKVLTEAGHELMSPLVTDTRGPVYAITGLSPLHTSAGMARLSRRGDDMRVIVAEEFLPKNLAGREEELLRRVITAYGDDSVQQLNGIWIVVENVSIVVSKILERARIGVAYLEQSTRYIFFDTKDENDKYKFHVLENLPEHLKEQFVATMNAGFDDYSEVVRKLTAYVRERTPLADETDRPAWLAATRAQACDAARALLPAAATTTVGLFASAQALESIIMKLLSEELEEAIVLGQRLLEAARKVAPVFFERADNPKYGGATTAYRGTNRRHLRNLSQMLFCKTDYAPNADAVRLVNYWPNDEDALLAEILFEYCDRDLEEISNRVSELTEEERTEIFETAIGERLNRRHRPGRAFEIPHFEWEILADFGSFRDLQRHRIIDAFEWQQLTTDYSADIPELAIEAGLEHLYKRCFNRSEELDHLLVTEGYEAEAQYAVLLGYRIRYRFVTNLREAFHLIELRTQESGHPGYRKICQEMYRLLCEVYPMSGAAMKFVNTGEDAELTRLAAERATQFKLERLDASIK